MTDLVRVEVEVNGVRRDGLVEPRVTLADFLRDVLGLKGTHVACEHGFCGNCNALGPLQTAFHENGGLQCGFCTPAMLLTAHEYLEAHPDGGTDEQIREAINGVLCRCTGYQHIVDSIRAAARAPGPPDPSPELVRQEAGT